MTEMPKPLSPLAWKTFYAEERAALGARGLEELIEQAPRITPSPGGAWVFPHTRLAHSGKLTAAVARLVVDAGVERVLALGVLHGVRDDDTDELRAVHGVGAPFDRGRANQEFSLDAFRALVDAAARVMHRPAPEIIERYPFRVGTDPATLPGFDELAQLLTEGTALVATADPVHHGVGYRTPRSECLERAAETTRQVAASWVDAQFDALKAHQFDRFLREASAHGSDFRDAGATLAALVGRNFDHRIVALELVDYHDVFDVAEPTWVAGALVEVRASVNQE